MELKRVCSECSERMVWFGRGRPPVVCSEGCRAVRVARLARERRARESVEQLAADGTLAEMRAELTKTMAEQAAGRLLDGGVIEAIDVETAAEIIAAVWGGPFPAGTVADLMEEAARQLRAG